MDVDQEITQHTILCDLCGKNIEYEEIHMTVKFIHLCPDCLDFLDTLPDDVQELLEKFLIGNVI